MLYDSSAPIDCQIADRFIETGAEYVWERISRPSAIPKPEFTHSLCAIDTTDLCIVELDHNARYIALSYLRCGAK